MSSARNLLLIQTFSIVAVALAFQGVAISQIWAVEPTVGTGKEDCLPGQEANNYLGVCVDPTCAPGQQLDPTGQTRYCVNIACPPGMIMDPNVHACVSANPPISNTCPDGSHGTIIHLSTGLYVLNCPNSFPPPFPPSGKTNGLHAPLGNAVNELPLKYHHGFSLSRNTTHSSNDTGGPIAMMSSDNPPGCSKQNPIPPNCTLNPFRNSSTSRATGGISSSQTGNATNAGSTTGNIKPFTTIGPQGHGQLHSSGQHHSGHHQKGSKQEQTGGSLSTGNSTGY